MTRSDPEVQATKTIQTGTPRESIVIADGSAFRKGRDFRADTMGRELP